MIAINLVAPKLNYEHGPTSQDVILVDWRPFKAQRQTGDYLPNFCLIIHRWRTGMKKARYVPLIPIADRLGGSSGRME